MNRLYLIAGILLAFTLSIGAAVHEHDVRIRADERSAIATKHADSVDAAVIPQQRALTDSIAALTKLHAADSTAAAAAVTQWATVIHPPKIVVRVDTLRGRVDTVFADAMPQLPQVIQAGNAMASKCTQAEVSCAQRAAALERDTTFMSQRIAVLEAAKSAVAPPRSCTAPTLAGALLGGITGGISGVLAGRHIR